MSAECTRSQIEMHSHHPLHSKDASFPLPKDTGAGPAPCTRYCADELELYLIIADLRIQFRCRLII